MTATDGGPYENTKLETWSSITPVKALAGKRQVWLHSAGWQGAMALPRFAAFSERLELCVGTLLLKLFPHSMAVGAS